jgi:hypothetical protein
LQLGVSKPEDQAVNRAIQVMTNQRHEIDMEGPYSSNIAISQGL